MKRILALFLFLTALAASSPAQNTTVSTSTSITDSDGQPWVGGSWKLEFYPNSSYPNLGQYYVNFGGTSTPLSTYTTSFSGNLNSFALFSQAVVSQDYITPTGSQWRLTVCPNASSACGVTTFIATGSTLNITPIANDTITAPRFLAVAGAYGYNNSETIIQQPQGATYWNVLQACQEYYDGISTWACASGSGGSGTTQPGAQYAIGYYPNAGTNPVIGPNAATTDANGNMIARSLQASVNSQFNVMSAPFGAKGDCTTDDAPAFTAAQNASLASYDRGGAGVVYLPMPPGGCYLIGPSFQYAGVPLIGQQGTVLNGTVILKGMPGYDVIHAPDPTTTNFVFRSNVDFENITFLVDNSVSGNTSLTAHRWPGRWADDIGMTAGSAVITSPRLGFTCSDIGQAIQVNGAGAGGTNLVTTVSNVTPCWGNSLSGNTVTLAAAASTTVTNAHTYLSVLNLPVTTTIGNCGLAFDNYDANSADWAYHGPRINSENAIFHNVRFTSTNGYASGNACSMFAQAAYGFYAPDVENFYAQSLLYGFVLVSSELNSYQTSGSNDFQTWKHGAITTVVYPWISVNGEAFNMQDVELSTNAGPQFLSLGNIFDDHPEGIISVTEFEGNNGGPTIGIGFRLEGAWDLTNTTLAGDATQTAYVDTFSSFCYQCGVSGGSGLIVNGSGNRLSLRSNNDPTPFQNNGIFNTISNSYSSTPSNGIYANNIRNLTPIKTVKDYFSLGTDFIRDGNYSVPYSMSDLMLWPQELIVPVANWSQYVQQDSTSPTNQYMIIQNGSQLQSWQQFKTSLQRFTVSTNVPAAPATVILYAKCPTGISSATLQIAINTVPVWSSVLSCTTSYATYSVPIDLTPYPNHQISFTSADNNIEAAWISVRPYLADVNGKTIVGAGTSLVTGPSVTTIGHCPQYTDTKGTTADAACGGSVSIPWVMPSFMSASPSTFTGVGSQTFSFNAFANHFVLGNNSGSTATPFPMQLGFTDLLGNIGTSQAPTSLSGFLRDASGVFSAAEIAGDCASTGFSLTCLKTNGVAFTGLATLVGSTNGDLAYFNGTAWTRFAGNSSGTNCFSENATGVPSWTACSGGGGGTTLTGWYDMVSQGSIDNTGATDVSSAIVTIINGLSSSTPNTLYFGPGTYKIDTGILISATSTTKGGIRLVGAGRDSTIFKSACTNGYAIWYNNTTNSGDNFNGMMLQDLQIQGTGGSACQDGVRFTQTALNVIERVKISGFSGNTVYTTGTIGVSGSTVTGSGTTFTSSMVPGVLQINGVEAEICTYNSATSLSLCDTAWPKGTVSTGTSYAVVYGGRALTIDPGFSYTQYCSFRDYASLNNLFGIYAIGTSSGGTSRCTVEGDAGWINWSGSRQPNSHGIWLGKHADTWKLEIPINNVARGIVMDSAHANTPTNVNIENNSTQTVVTTCNGGVASQSCLVGIEISADAAGSGYGNTINSPYIYLAGNAIQVDNTLGATNLTIEGLRSASFSNTNSYSFNGVTGCPTGYSNLTILDWDCTIPSASGTVNTGTANHITYYPSSTNAVSSDPNLDDGATTANTLTYNQTGGIAASAGPITGTAGILGAPSTAAKAAIPSGAHGFACDESSTAGVPATGVDYIRCSSGHAIVESVNGNAEASIVLAGVDINSSFQVISTHLSAALPVNQGGTGTTSTLSGIVRGGSPMTAAELSGDATTSGSNAVTVVKVNGLAIPVSAPFVGTNSSGQFVSNPLTVINPQTATYTVTATDFSSYKTITSASGTFTATLPVNTSQPPAGQYVRFINYGTGVITIARNGQNLNGSTTSIILPAAPDAQHPTMAIVVSDGTNYFAGTAFPATTTTGTGNVVLATSPTLVTPALGTPSALNLSNATSLPATALPAGILSCSEVWSGSGTASALTSGDDAISNNSCYNDSGLTRTITAVKARSSAASNTTTVNPTFGSAGTGTTICSSALTAGSSYVYSSTCTISNASWTTGTGIDPGMGGTLTGTSIAVIVEYHY